MLTRSADVLVKVPNDGGVAEVVVLHCGIEDGDKQALFCLDGTSTRRGDTVADTGMAGCVVVFNAGSKAESSIADGLSGQMPHFENEAVIVVGVRARARAW